MKTLATAAAIVLVPLTWTPSAADADAPTCQGQPATVVGQPGSSVHGTDGPDVVVSNGAAFVFTGAGDDLICMTGTTADTHRTKVSSGAGADVVRATSTNPVLAELGIGQDVFRGGTEPDSVRGGEYEEIEGQSGYEFVYNDDERDDISTGAGRDKVVASSEDTIALGKGDDRLGWGGESGETFTGDANGGAGQNSLDIGAGDAEGQPLAKWVLDSRAESLSRNGAVKVSWTSFTQFSVSTNNLTSLLLRGSARDESFQVSGGVNPQLVTVRAGGGDDTLYISSGDRGFDFDGGGGRDLVSIVGVPSSRASVVVDLTAETYRYEDTYDTSAAPVTSIEDVEVRQVYEVTVRGNGLGNRLTVYANQNGGAAAKRCQITISGRGGDDRLALSSSARESGWKNCPPGVLRGEAGNDVLTGSLLAERLIGGSGRDTARGGPGRDLCVAEITMGCERR